MTLVTTIFYTILVFFVIIGIHEWGHMIFAKRAGILVREFAIGFGPKLISFKKGETRYSFRLLPFGGFARMAGEDPELVQVNPGQTVAVRLHDDTVTHIYLDRLEQYQHLIQGEVVRLDIENDLYIELELDGQKTRYDIDPKALMIARGQETQIAPLDRQFASKSVGKRALAIFGGPLMNFVLAIVLFGLYVVMVGIPKPETGSLVIVGVAEQSPAEAGGMQAGDQVVSINGEPILGDDEKLTGMISASLGEPMKWEVLRDGEKVELTLTPQMTDGSAKIGVEIGLKYDEYRRPTIVEVATGTWKQMTFWTDQIFVGLKKLAMLDVDLKDLGGPVDIARTTGLAAQAGATTLILWMAVLSLYLGIFNLLPVPALDGSRLVFLGIEAVRGKPVSQERESLVHLIGFSALFLLMIAVTYYDIIALFQS